MFKPVNPTESSVFDTLSDLALFVKNLAEDRLFYEAEVVTALCDRDHLKTRAEQAEKNLEQRDKEILSATGRAVEAEEDRNFWKKRALEAQNDRDFWSEQADKAQRDRDKAIKQAAKAEQDRDFWKGSAVEETDS
jgi:hypothetical protein